MAMGSEEDGDQVSADSAVDTSMTPRAGSASARCSLFVERNLGNKFFGHGLQELDVADACRLRDATGDAMDVEPPSPTLTERTDDTLAADRESPTEPTELPLLSVTSTPATATRQTSGGVSPKGKAAGRNLKAVQHKALRPKDGKVQAKASAAAVPAVAAVTTRAAAKTRSCPAASSKAKGLSKRVMAHRPPSICI